MGYVKGFIMLVIEIVEVTSNKSSDVENNKSITSDGVKRIFLPGVTTKRKNAKKTNT